MAPARGGAADGGVGVARPGLFKNKKFARLSRTLKSQALAAGVLELLWHACYEACDERVGSAADVAFSVAWTDRKVNIAAALRDAGFLDDDPEHPGEFRVHDLWDHAPQYVTRRMEREQARRVSGQRAKCSGLASHREVNDESMASQGADRDKPLSSTPGTEQYRDQDPPLPPKGDGGVTTGTTTAIGRVVLTDAQRDVVERIASRWPDFCREQTGALGRFRPALDGPAVIELASRYDEARIWRMARVMLKADSLNGKIRNPKLLAEMAPEFDRWLLERGE